MYRALLIALLSSSFIFITPVNSQFGTLGGGLLSSQYLQTGGLIYPNADGSGPQVESLAAAIYGIAIPPGFNQFSASENFYGGSNDPFGNSFGGNSRIDGVRPSDLLIGTGLHVNGNGGGGHQGSYSSYINDFSLFGDFGSHNDLQRSSSSSYGDIDPIAARFGVVIPNSDHQSTIFHPSLSGSVETSNGGTNTGVGDGVKQFTSPVETSLHFNLPTQVTLPDGIQSTLHDNANNISPDIHNGLSRADQSSSSSNFTPPPTSDSGNNSMDVITTAFKFSDEQIKKTEESKRNFEETTAAHIASGQFLANMPSAADFDATKNPQEEADESPPIAVNKHKHFHRQRQSYGSKSKEPKGMSKGAMVLKSPYVYRGGHRERQAQPSVTSTVFYDPPFENIPLPEYLKSSSEPNDKEYGYPSLSDPNNEQYNTYTFLTAPGYRIDE